MTKDQRNRPVEVSIGDGRSVAERRKSPRATIQVGVRFRTEEALTQAVHAYTLNIGLGGLCLLTHGTYEKGTPLDLTIEVGASETLLVRAVVAWARPGKAVGVRFLDLDAHQRTRLETLIHPESAHDSVHDAPTSPGRPITPTRR